MNIAFIIFNRPEYTQKVFDEIRKARPKKLFIIADGPRNSQEAFLCDATRKIVEQIDWECIVLKNYSETNLGCKNRISTGLNWFFEHVESGIILEDDCVPHQSFFRFADEMLEQYKYDERIAMVAGSNSLSEFHIQDSYTFSRYFAIWGWATWRRAWAKYDINMTNWPEHKKSGFLKKIYLQKYMVDHTTNLFDQSFYGETDTWDTQWFYTCLQSGGLSIVPAKNLISNIGIDGTRAPGKNQQLPTFNLYENQISLAHPTIVEANVQYDNLLYEKNYKDQPGFISVLVQKIKPAVYIFLKKFKVVKQLHLIFIKMHVTLFGYGICENVNHSHHDKNCLVLYITQPFKVNDKSYQHQNHWQVKEIARVIGESGYNVDVVNYNDKKVRLNKQYDLVLDIHPEPNNVYKKNLRAGAKIIAYITGSNPTFSNEAEKARLRIIEQTTGVVLKTERAVGAFDKNCLESFDSVFMIGNKQTLSTYGGFNFRQVHLLPNTGYAFLNNTDFSKKSPKHFLFLSGSGLVHKGLHLLLNVFMKNPDLHLHICSDLESESDFCKLYRKELFETPNIHPVGHVDITSDTFRDITNLCSYIISASCSEGMSGAVLTGMSAGIIPIVSKESGFDEDVAFILSDLEEEYLGKTIREFSEKPMSWIEDEGKETMVITNTRFSNKNFSEQISRGIRDVI